MKELVEHIVKALVDSPDDVKVSVDEDGERINISLNVHAEDVGKIIGKKGRVANAIRSVATAASKDSNKRIRLDIS